MAEVKLVQEWNGHKAGETVEVGDYTAVQLVKAKVAEAPEAKVKKAKKEVEEETTDKKVAKKAK